MLLFFFISGIGFILIREYSNIYSWSSILPEHIRKKWIQKVHTMDYNNWLFFESVLQNKFPFFRLLSAKEQTEFIVRVIDVKNYMLFEGREGVVLDDEKLTLLSASMVQLTFGFNNYRLYRFEKIIIYPGVFYSKFLDTDVKGITYGTGYVFLSWTDFEEGYIEYRNKLNLGLHEFAHALMLQKAKYFDSYLFETFTRMANYIMKQAEETGEEDPLFREYGLSNHHEFWAVCVEVFFEQPIEFKHTYPRLYNVMQKLLWQDPAALLEAYLVSDKRRFHRRF